MVWEHGLFGYMLVAWMALAVVTFVGLLFVTAPYGRHARQGWGLTVDNRLAWIIMEAPAALVFAACFLLGEETHALVLVLFFALWEVHYIHRAFVYPLGLTRGAKRMPVLIAGMALLFNGVNGYLNGRYLALAASRYPGEWMGDARFLAGVLLFVVGFVANRHSDGLLRRLRAAGEQTYDVPYGGLFRWVSCPNYLGEIVQWMGWALATWSLPGLAFAVWTIANLAPRARSHHEWYRQHFQDYPPGRKALVPGLW